MLIEPAQPGDIAVLNELAFAAKRVWRYSDAQMEIWRDSLQIDAASIAAGHATVLRHEGNIAGFYVLNHAVGQASLDHLWIHPAYMRRGFGRALLAHARARARQAGAASILIDSDPNAEAFYLASGATRTSLVSAPIPGDSGRVRPQMSLPVAI